MVIELISVDKMTIMKNHLSLIILVILVGVQNLYSQENKTNQETIARLTVVDWTKNGENMTTAISDQNVILVIYRNKETNELLMANFWQKSNSQSYGRIYSLESKHEEESAEKYKSDLFFFQWGYVNTYDNKKGTAKVELLKVYKPQGIYFKMTIIPENLDILIYKGYMEGTLDLSVYERK